jgi:hypothetical protein
MSSPPLDARSEGWRQSSPCKGRSGSARTYPTRPDLGLWRYPLVDETLINASRWREASEDVVGVWRRGSCLASALREWQVPRLAPMAFRYRIGSGWDGVLDAWLTHLAIAAGSSTSSPAVIFPQAVGPSGPGCQKRFGPMSIQLGRRHYMSRPFSIPMFGCSKRVGR